MRLDDTLRYRNCINPRTLFHHPFPWHYVVTYVVFKYSTIYSYHYVGNYVAAELVGKASANYEIKRGCVK